MQFLILEMNTVGIENKVGEENVCDNKYPRLQEPT